MKKTKRATHLRMTRWSKTILIEQSETTLIKGNNSLLGRRIFPRHQNGKTTTFLSDIVTIARHSNYRISLGEPRAS